MHPSPGQTWQVRRFANINDVYTGVILSVDTINGVTLYRTRFPFYKDIAYLPRDRFYSMISDKKEYQKRKRIVRINKPMATRLAILR